MDIFKLSRNISLILIFIVGFTFAEKWVTSSIQTKFFLSLTSPLSKSFSFYENKPEKFMSLFKKAKNKRDREFVYSSFSRSRVLAYAQNSNGETILHLIFRKNLKHKERKFLLQNFLKAGADPNKKDLFGKSAGDMLLASPIATEEVKSYLRLLLEFHFDCDEIREGLPFMHRILETEGPIASQPIIKLCLLYGANPFVINARGESLIDIIEALESSEEKEGLKRLIFETVEFNYRKLLAHAFGIAHVTKLSDGEANLEGLLVSLSHRALVKLDTAFYRELSQEIIDGKGALFEQFESSLSNSLKEKIKTFSKKEREELAKILLETNKALEESLDYWHIPKEEMTSRIKRGELVALKASASQHLYGYIVFKNKLYLCNKGYYYLQAPGIIRLDVQGEADWPRFLNLITARMPIEELFQKVEGQRTYLENLLNTSKRSVFLLQNLQDVGNCTFVNTSSMQVAALNLLFDERLSLKSRHSKEIANAIKHLSKSQRRENLLKEYLSFHQLEEAGPADFHLLIKIGAKTTESQLHDLFNRTLLANWLAIGDGEFIEMNLAKNYQFKVAKKKNFKRGKEALLPRAS